MPRRVTAWACEFRCGYKVYTDKKRIEIHEDTCLSNPKNKACKTCINFIDYGVNSFDEPDCKIDYLSDEASEKNPHGLRIDCKEWRQCDAT